jgi:hypothetical protein
MDDQTQNPQPDDDTVDAPSEADDLRAQLDAAQTATAEARAAQAAAIATLRETMREANPAIPPALIDGNSPEELTASLADAKAIAADAVERARAAAGNGHSPGTPVPSGHLPPPADSWRDLSPAEKIRAGLTRR